MSIYVIPSKIWIGILLSLFMILVLSIHLEASYAYKAPNSKQESISTQQSYTEQALHTYQASQESQHSQYSQQSQQSQESQQYQQSQESSNLHDSYNRMIPPGSVFPLDPNSEEAKIPISLALNNINNDIHENEVESIRVVKVTSQVVAGMIYQVFVSIQFNNNSTQERMIRIFRNLNGEYEILESRIL